MKKQHLFIILSVVLLGFVFGIIQYYQALRTEDVSAVTVGIPNPGHSLAQLECSADSLCVDTVNKKVGIGTANPIQKLTISGTTIYPGTIPSADAGTDRPTVYVTGQYPNVVIASNGNANHGSTLGLWSWDGSTNTNQWNIGGGQSGNFSIGYAKNSWNPHSGINGWTNSTDSAFTALQILPNGNIGIGTTTPSSKLEIVGRGKFSDGVQRTTCPSGMTLINIAGPSDAFCIDTIEQLYRSPIDSWNNCLSRGMRLPTQMEAMLWCSAGMPGNSGDTRFYVASFSGPADAGNSMLTNILAAHCQYSGYSWPYMYWDPANDTEIRSNRCVYK